MIVTVLRNGKQFGPEHVQWLAKQIGNQSPMVCLSDEPIEGVDTIKLSYNWPGWWAKLEILRHDLNLGPFLYLDLDTVITGDISKFTHEAELTVLNDMSGQRHINSGMLFVPHNPQVREPFDYFKQNAASIIQEHQGGDQQYLQRFWSHASRWQDKYPGQIVSYKKNILKEGFTGKEEVVLFHGQPRPWGTDEEWVPKLEPIS